MALSEVKPPPKPTRSRASSNPTKSIPPNNGVMINVHIPHSLATRAPVPIPRSAQKTILAETGGYLSSIPIATVSAELQLPNAESRSATGPIERRAGNPQGPPGIPPKPTSSHNKYTNQSIATTANNNSKSNNNGSSSSFNKQEVSSQASEAPMPPPKPKRISLAPQPKAKPLSLQSVPLLSKTEAPARSSTSLPSIPTPSHVALSSSTTTTSSSASPSTAHKKIPSANQSQESVKPKSIAANNAFAIASQTQVQPLTPPTPPAKKPRSQESSLNAPFNPIEPLSTLQQQQWLQSQMREQPSSPPPHMSKSHPNVGSESLATPTTSERQFDSATGTNPTLIGARSRLRSVSDAKASTSLTMAVSQSSRSPTTQTTLFDNDGFGLLNNKGCTSAPLVSPTYLPPHSGRNGTYPYADIVDDGSSGTAASEKLAASLHKIQALAQGQTERMKQINYAEKKADLAEAVYEKSSLWRARGAEWGGIAKKVWEDRGGMGGIAGGFADRWKRRVDGANDGTPDYPGPGPAAQIFGIPLEEAVRLSKISASTGVPAVVTRCIEYLDVMGVEEVGLYRVPGSTSNVARLKTMFDSGHDYDFLQKGNQPQHPHDVATLLKLYLRELPSPIIPLDAMSAFNNIDFSDQDQSRSIGKLRENLRLLPLENYLLMGTLCRHLSNLADYDHHTKMNISNLGLIFCPTLQIGSVLFKHLLGGDGNEEERRKCLLAVWADLEIRHEEMENLEMIKNFEMGLQIGRDEASATSGAVLQEDRKSQELERQSWEQVDHNPVDLTQSLPQSQPPVTSQQQSHQNPSVPRSSSHDSSGSGSRMGGVFDSFMPAPVVESSEPIMDLYDELMTRELTEATNTPLIDLDFNDNNDLQSMQEENVSQGDQWRRHAREPAINRRQRSPSPLPLGVTRHERFPAVSIRNY
ncbi:hypothetical protein BX616_011236 [Lobosporangium transversale]|uniref:Rho-GAP domain-containing protein n=1 Tax=Lobosporangium transversale TaxID=64571 RepID=A0A1Y2GCP8_9FUNG|nr:hypothetical protein BCR41DRAFT_360197 [Lobosporangium transversale]KAF9909288.1 hypothetical protein BX616_011236 [Lobosporangium transversale]ORZ07213.1 hypothetical protein BCR41DRAFT_360197 [Lobosporangium transversale]|eukprot:XP_021877876.1 hypothetical protein BCR41DRAFT_360197 [Lobosporangium transversale]